MNAILAVLLLGLPAQGPELHVESSRVAKGIVRVGPPLQHRFTLENRGSIPLHILEVQASCGCLTPVLSRRDLPPGERADLQVEVNTLSQAVGDHRWLFHVRYRAGESVQETTLELLATLRQEIVIQPAALVLQGRGELQARVTFRDPRPQPLNLTRLESTSTHLEPRLEPRPEPDGSRVIQVRVADSCPAGKHVESVVLTSDDPDYRQIKLPVTIIRPEAQDVSVSPGRVTLVGPGSMVLQVRAAQGSVRIHEVVARSPVINVRWVEGPGDLATLRVGLNAAQWNKQPFTTAVDVNMSSPAGASLVIPVQVRTEE